MLAKAGLVEGKDYKTVLLDGFDPVVHIILPGHRRLPRLQVERARHSSTRAGVPFTLFDPSKDGIPGSFGVIYTDAGVPRPSIRRRCRTSCGRRMRGMEDAVADPAAAQAAVDLINAAGNKNFLSPEGETFRWTTESGLVTQFTPKGQPVGPDRPGRPAVPDRRLRRRRHLHQEADDRRHLRLRRSSPASTARTGRSSGRPGERRLRERLGLPEDGQEVGDLETGHVRGGDALQAAEADGVRVRPRLVDEQPGERGREVAPRPSVEHRAHRPRAGARRRRRRGRRC